MISVIVPAYRAPLLQQCVSRLLEQRLEDEFEVIVAVSADAAEELPDLEEHPRLQVLTHVPRLPAAVARNRAAAQARGHMLAFTDADVMVTPDWLARLIDASEGRCCVAGSVVNGTPHSAAGTAEYLVEFLVLHPARPAGSIWHGATCNLLMPRELWAALGPFPEDMDGGEDTVLTVQARRLGRFRFAPAAAAAHVNRTSWVAVLRHQFAFGRFNARLARRSPLRGGQLLRRPVLAPLAMAGRLVSLYARAAACDTATLRRAIRLFPGIALTLLAWSSGLLAEQLRPAPPVLSRRGDGPPPR